jgi:LPS-assembly lipoprotein
MQTKTTRRRCLIAAVVTLGLAGCGFELRQAPNYAFQTMYSNIPVGSTIGLKLLRGMESSGKVEVITDTKQVERAQVIFEQLAEWREKVIISRTASGAIREFQLRLRYKFRVRTQGGKELIPDTEMAITRDINFNETGALSKESEEAMLYRDMENDLVLQIQRRLAAIRSL